MPDSDAAPSADAAPGRDYVSRDTTGLITFVVATAVAVFLVVDVVVRGDWRYLGFFLPLLLFVEWFLWLMLVLPSVRWNSERLLITNIGRVHEIPWARVDALTQRLYLVVGLDDGRSVNAIAATASRGPGMLVRSATSRVFDVEAARRELRELLEAARSAAPPSAERPTVRWHLPALVIGAVLLVATVLGIVLFG